MRSAQPLTYSPLTHQNYRDAPAALGGRKGDDGPAGELANTPKVGDVAAGAKDYIPKGFSKEDIKDMGGSLKVHVRLALEVDIRIIAKVKGDICIGIL